MSRTMTITEARLRVLLDSYGADPGRWPETERAAALALLARRPDLAAERERAARLDALLAVAERPRASGVLTARLMQAAPRGRSGWLAVLWPFGPAWQAAFALTLALLLGLASGPMLPQEQSFEVAQQDPPEEVALLLATSSFEEDSL